MNIGSAARASGVSAKMIHYYEAKGLVPEPDRQSSGYRVYGEDDVHRLVFVRRARDLGFSVEEIKELLGLWSDRSRSNKEVREIALKHVADLEAQAARLQEMIGTLNGLIGSCRNATRPECPIMSELSGGAKPPCCDPAQATPQRRKSRTDARSSLR